MGEPTDDLLSVLLAHERFIKNAELVRQWLDKLSVESQQTIIDRMVSIPNLKFDVLRVIIEKNNAICLEIYMKILHFHLSRAKRF